MCVGMCLLWGFQPFAHVISRHTLKLAHTHSLNVTADMLIDNKNYLFIQMIKPSFQRMF